MPFFLNFLIFIYISCHNIKVKLDKKNNTNIKNFNLTKEKPQRKLEGDDIEFKPIRIIYDISCLKLNNQEFFKSVVKSLEKVNETLSKLIKVRRLSRNITITQDIYSKQNEC